MSLLHLHNRVFENLSKRFNGRIVKSTGDGFLIEFSDSKEAVTCAILIQVAFRKYNLNKPNAVKLLVRIGMDVGEISQRGTDIFGMAVNIASRLENITVPGEIFVTKKILESIIEETNLEMDYVDNFELRHVAEPIEVYQPRITEDMISSSGRDDIEQFMTDKAEEGEDSKGVLEDSDRDHFKNQIAVLEFRVLSPDPNDNYLGESFSEALIFGFSKEKQVIVHELETVKALGDLAQDISQVASILGARYIVKGSIQRAGKTLRVRVDLIRSTDNSTLFSDSFDGSDEEIFDIQNKVVKSILFSIILRLTDEVKASLSSSMPKNQIAANFFLKGSYQYKNATTWAEYKRGISMLQSAVNVDKTFALGYAVLARACVDVYGKWHSDKSWLEKAEKAAEKAIELDPDLSEAYLSLGWIYSKTGQLDEAEVFYQNSLEIRPEAIVPRRNLSLIYYNQGRFEESIVILNEAYEISLESGNQIVRAEILNEIGVSEYRSGFFLQALEKLNKALEIAKSINTKVHIAGFRMTIGNAFLNMGKLSLALKNFQISLELMTELGLKKSIAGLHNNIGTIYESQGKLPLALTCFDKGIELSEQIGDQQTEAALLNNMGRVLGNSGENIKAIDILKRSAKLRHETGDNLKEGKTLVALAAVQCDLGSLDEALATYKKANEIFINAIDYSSQLATLLNIGEIYEFKREFKKADKYYEEAMDYFSPTRASKYGSYFNLFRGRSFLLQGRIEEGEKELELAASDESAPIAVRHRAMLYYDICVDTTKRSDESLNSMESAVEKLEEIGSYPELTEAIRIFGEHLLNTDRRELGIKYLERGRELARESKMKWEFDWMDKLLSQL